MTTIRFKFSKRAAQAAAREIRRGSWGMGTAAVVAGIKTGRAGLAAAGAFAWVIMQFVAFVVDGLDECPGERDEL
jgi:hypothetical protein